MHYNAFIRPSTKTIPRISMLSTVTFYCSTTSITVINRVVGTGGGAGGLVHFQTQETKHELPYLPNL